MHMPDVDRAAEADTLEVSPRLNGSPKVRQWASDPAQDDRGWFQSLNQPSPPGGNGASDAAPAGWEARGGNGGLIPAVPGDAETVVLPRLEMSRAKAPGESTATAAESPPTAPAAKDTPQAQDIAQAKDIPRAERADDDQAPRVRGWFRSKIRRRPAGPSGAGHATPAANQIGDSYFGLAPAVRPDVLTDAETVVLPVLESSRAKKQNGSAAAGTADSPAAKAGIADSRKPAEAAVTVRSGVALAEAPTMILPTKAAPAETAPAPVARKASLYDGATAITGELREGNKVEYVRTVNGRERRTLWGILVVNYGIGLAFLSWLGLMTWTEVHSPNSGTTVQHAFLIAMGCLMASIEGIRMLQSFTLGYFTLKACDPIPLIPKPGMRVAILTTIVPGSEPWDMVLNTLKAMQRIYHDTRTDVWVLDEGDDPEIRADCRRWGINHFSRKGVPEWNTPSGACRRKTKSGNHNSWRSAHEDKYDVVAQMDPDHLPDPSFLIRTVGYFNDPDVGFVVAPQVYGRNFAENWIARASAVLAYIFHGVIQRGLNGLKAPMLIGTNHLYRVTCWKQIGGYCDRLVEDHRTCMEVYSHRNPVTGNRWTGVYTPDIVADGEGPTSFTDFYNQQKRWAWGVWQIMVKDSIRVLPKLRPRQQLAFAMLQQFYPSVAISWCASIILTALFLFSGVATHLPIAQWAVLWVISITSSFGLFFWLRRFNLVEHERQDWGMSGLYLMLMTLPTFVEAAVEFCSGRPLIYAVTAKGDLASPDRFKTFRPNLFWIVVAACFFSLPFFGIGSDYLSMHIWMAVTIAICIAPLCVHFGVKLRLYRHERRGVRKAKPLSLAWHSNSTSWSLPITPSCLVEPAIDWSPLMISSLAVTQPIRRVS